MALVKYSETDKQLQEKKGQHLYKNNKTMQDVANVMEHPEFRSFVNKYFTDPVVAQSMLLLMKVYQVAEDSDPTATPYQKLNTVDAVMNNPKGRKFIHDEFIKWRTTGHSNALSIKDRNQIKKELVVVK